MSRILWIDEKNRSEEKSTQKKPANKKGMETLITLQWITVTHPLLQLTHFHPSLCPIPDMGVSKQKSSPRFFPFKFNLLSHQGRYDSVEDEGDGDSQQRHG
jgi:hypothetical protein